MKRFAAILTVVLCAAGAFAGTEYVTDGGVDNNWVNDPDFAGYTGNGVINTNVTFEWWGGQAWNLAGWDGAGNHTPTGYYIDGQYGPSKAPRDFTNATFGGQVPAFSTGWVTAPDGSARGERPDQPGSGDYAINVAGNRSIFYVTDAAPAEGTRMLLSFDYATNDYRFDVRIWGLNDNNQNMTPYFSWDTIDGVADATTVVQPGPDHLLAWQTGSGASTGQQLYFDGDVAQTGAASDAASWDTYQALWTVPAAEAGRGGAFDRLAFQLYGFDNSVIESALDNLSILEIPDGDGNLDGVVDDADYTIWADNYGLTGATFQQGDFNEDGTVDDADYTIWADNYGVGAVVTPEPATLSLLALGAAAVIRRRK